VAVAVLAAALVGLVLPLSVLKLAVGAMLILLGASRLQRHRHPRWGGMRIGSRDLAIWSFLMASAHGAGLMIVPFALAAGRGGAEAAQAAATAVAGHGHGHAAHLAHAGGHDGSGMLAAGEALNAAAGAGILDAAAALGTVLHTAGYLLVTALLAVIIHDRVGLRFLRTAWINVDAVWAGALVVTGVFTLIV
jgi:hypothetical protein